MKTIDKHALIMSLSAIGGTMGMLAHDISGRLDKETVENQQHLKRIHAGLQSMRDLHHYFADLAWDIRQDVPDLHLPPNSDATIQ